MIKIGKTFLFTLAQAAQTKREQKQNYQTLAEQTEQEARALQEQYAQKWNYLFQTAAEKNQQALQAARQALALHQAQRAAHGVTDTSASAVQEKQNTKLRAELEQAHTQTALQQEGAAQEKKFKAKWLSLLNRATAYRQKASRTGRLGSLGRAISTLFK